MGITFLFCFCFFYINSISIYLLFEQNSMFMHLFMEMCGLLLASYQLIYGLYLAGIKKLCLIISGYFAIWMSNIFIFHLKLIIKRKKKGIPALHYFKYLYA